MLPVRHPYETGGAPQVLIWLAEEGAAGPATTEFPNFQCGGVKTQLTKDIILAYKELWS